MMAHRVGWRAQALFAPIVALVLGLPAGLIFWYLQSEYNKGERLPFYSNRQKRLTKMEPYIDYKRTLHIQEEIKKNEIAAHNVIVQSSTAYYTESEIVSTESENT